MKTIEKKFICDGTSYNLVQSIKGVIDVYFSEDDRYCMITKQGSIEVITQIEADCGQNIGFLTLVN